MCRAQVSRVCVECGTAFSATDHRAEFCSRACRNAEANRRHARGAVLFDLYVHKRFNRSEAQEEGLPTLIDRMMSNWVEEDRAAGRRTMRPLKDVKRSAIKNTAFRCKLRAGR